MTETPSRTGGQKEAPGPRLGKRSRGRAITLKYLYGVDLGGPTRGEDFERFVVHQNEKGPAVTFARELVAGVLAHREALDDLLRRLATNWSLDRMAVIDRNILRIACYELLFEKGMPAGVCINEAVELAKRFGSSQSGSFVNGILDQVRRRRDAGEDISRIGAKVPDEGPQET
jgi:N utilization substance protein B